MAEQSIGGIWTKNTNGKTWLSGQIEIEGVKHGFVAFTNDYKEQGDNKPDYRILPAKKKEQVSDESCPF